MIVVAVMSVGAGVLSGCAATPSPYAATPAPYAATSAPLTSISPSDSPTIAARSDDSLGGTIMPRASRSKVAPSVVVLGDSVASGYACACEEFGERVAAGLSGGLAIRYANHAAAGELASDVVDELTSQEPVRASVAGADVVLVTAGANDLYPLVEAREGAGCDPSCVAEGVDQSIESVVHLVTRVRSLAPTARIVVTDYWDVFFLDPGDPAFDAWADQVTVGFDQRLALALAATDATLVSTYGPFHTTPGGVTALLAADGDHPNDAGHALIARLVLDALR